MSGSPRLSTGILRMTVFIGAVTGLLSCAPAKFTAGTPLEREASGELSRSASVEGSTSSARDETVAALASPEPTDETRVAALASPEPTSAESPPGPAAVRPVQSEENGERPLSFREVMDLALKNNKGIHDLHNAVVRARLVQNSTR